MQQLSRKQLLLVGFTLFSMFFGAGNLIFPPQLGAQAGVQTWPAMAGLAISAIGLPIVFFYCLCAVIRLAFFNVIEGKRQQTEGGCNKTYRGLPVTTSSMILPLVYLLRFVLPGRIFRVVLHLVMAVTAYLFVLDFSVKKPDWSKILFVAK